MKNKKESNITTTHRKNEIMSNDVMDGSFYDFNYAEIPFCWLTKTKPTGLDRIQINYSDTILFGNNKYNREYTVEALSLHERKELLQAQSTGELTLSNSMIGFGGPWTLDVVYELHQLWVENGKNNSDIIIGTVYQFLKRIRKKIDGRNYIKLIHTLRCLNGIHVKAKNSLYKIKETCLCSMDFYLFPHFSHNEKTGILKISIDQKYFNRIKSNCLMWVPFNADYYYSLTPLQKRLALYLGKIFNPRYPKYDTWNRDIVNFAKQMPLLTKSKINAYRTIKRALDGLIENKFPFLDNYSYKNGVITFINKNPGKIKTNTEQNIDLDNFHKQNETLNNFNIKDILNDLTVPLSKKEQRVKKEMFPKITLNDILDLTRDYNNIQFYNKCILKIDREIIYRIISEVRFEGNDKKKLFNFKMRDILKKMEIKERMKERYV